MYRLPLVGCYLGDKGDHDYAMSSSAQSKWKNSYLWVQVVEDN